MADENWTGYDAGFLSIPLPLPRPVGGAQLRELPYPRFTVLLDATRRLAAMTGVNIDGGALQDLPRTGDWDLDPRIPADEQTGAAIYARNDLDRGHLVRRRDPGWGTEAEARAATEATFFYTNAAPQVNVFNQSKDLWLGLEDHVLAYADATDQRVSVFTAPVLDSGDPQYRGIGIPRRFFKVVAWVTTPDDGMPDLAAAGFVLDQSDLLDTTDGAFATPPLGTYRTFQVPIADIELLAGVDFGALADADVMSAERALAGEWNELDGPSDIRL
nr:DNA/RNA non-specific endonuclease [Microbacterium sp. 2FI]